MAFGPNIPNGKDKLCNYRTSNNLVMHRKTEKGKHFVRECRSNNMLLSAASLQTLKFIQKYFEPFNNFASNLSTIVAHISSFEEENLLERLEIIPEH